MYKIGEKVRLKENYLCEQSDKSVPEGVKTVIDAKDIILSGNSLGQWIKIKEHSEWIHSLHFDKIKKCRLCNGRGVAVFSCCTGEPVDSDYMICPECDEHLGEEECPECGGTGLAL